MEIFARAVLAVVAVCLGELLVMLACFPLAAIGILPDGPQGIEVPALLLIIAAPVIWLVAFAGMMLVDFEP